MWPPARWANGLLWWLQTAINNVVFGLVKISFLYWLFQIKFTTTTCANLLKVLLITWTNAFIKQCFFDRYVLVTWILCFCWERWYFTSWKGGHFKQIDKIETNCGASNVSPDNWSICLSKEPQWIHQCLVATNNHQDGDLGGPDPRMGLFFNWFQK